MNNPESILENKTHKYLWDFNTQTDHLISARWPDLVIVNKKRNLAKWNWKKAKKEFQDLTRKLKKKTIEHEGYDDTNCNWWAWYCH